MYNKLLGFITAFILIFALSFGISAAPALSGIADTALENGITADLFESDAEDTGNTQDLTGNAAEFFSAGLGTKEHPYIIGTGEQLALMAKLVNENAEGFSDAYYMLGNDIDLGKSDWTPIGSSEQTPFEGSFDGNGYTIGNFTISQHEYTGLFGYILNGTVKNLSISDFEIDSGSATDSDYDTMYIGALAGYIYSTRGESNISGVGIKDGTIGFDGSIGELYVGGIAGYAGSFISAKVNIHDCYTDITITAVNTTGYNYVGGLVGELYTGSGALSSIIHSYSKGSINSTSDHSSRAGGLVGYLESYGSSYAPTSTAGLLADVDIMIINSFTVTNISSLSTRYTSYAGYIVGDITAYAAMQNVYYPSDAGITVEAKKISTTGKAVMDSSGSSTSLSNLKSRSYLSASRGFDFTNTWTISENLNGGFPYHLITISEKPEIKTVEINIGEKSADNNVRYFEIDGFQYPLYERPGNIIRVVPEKDLLIEIVEKESSDSLYAVSTNYFFADYETLTSTPISSLGCHMGNNKHSTIRTKDPLSLRFTSQITTVAKYEKTDFTIEEYGFIVGVKSLIEKENSQLNFDFSKYATGVSYSKKSGIDLIFDSRNDNICIFTGILVNVKPENYNTVVTSKNYTKISIDGNEFIVYGEPVNTSMYQTAKEQISSLDEADPNREVLQQIIDAVDGE